MKFSNSELIMANVGSLLTTSTTTCWTILSHWTFNSWLGSRHFLDSLHLRDKKALTLFMPEVLRILPLLGHFFLAFSTFLCYLTRLPLPLNHTFSTSWMLIIVLICFKNPKFSQLLNNSLILFLSTLFMEFFFFFF